MQCKGCKKDYIFMQNVFFKLIQFVINIFNTKLYYENNLNTLVVKNIYFLQTILLFKSRLWKKNVKYLIYILLNYVNAKAV